jgi:hypothetical protein
MRQYPQAETYWTRYLEAIDIRQPAPPGHLDYTQRLSHECLIRLASRNYDAENWAAALGYYERVRQFKPDDAEVLERLFHLYNQLRRYLDARVVLDQLRGVRSNTPQLELYEIEANEVKNADDVLRLLDEMERVVRKYAMDVTIAERANAILNNMISFMVSLEKQYREQLKKTEASLYELPSYQVNWPEVHGYLRDFRVRLAKMRRAIEKANTLATLEKHRRQLTDLRDRLERDVELCRTLAGR